MRRSVATFLRGIEAERELALSGIAARPAAPVYGFTTLLGLLDGYASDELQTETVLSAHLVGDGGADVLGAVDSCGEATAVV